MVRFFFLAALCLMYLYSFVLYRKYSRKVLLIIYFLPLSFLLDTVYIWGLAVGYAG